MNVEFLPAAAAELEDAVGWYNQQRYGLGEELRTEVARAVDRILIFPNGWARVSRRSRRCQTRKFPYGVIYQVRADSILIVAIAQLNRKPGYWKGRTGE
jgi:plasmid stabilization system protein ParE